MVSQHALQVVSQHALQQGNLLWGVPTPRGCLLWGACSGGVPAPGGACSQGGVETPRKQTATVADGTHPTGMHSCYKIMLHF